MSRQDDRFRKAIRLVSEAAQGRKIKTFCGAVIGNSQKVFFIWRACRVAASPIGRARLGGKDDDHASRSG
jgi:hypothetical protein